MLEISHETFCTLICLYYKEKKKKLFTIPVRTFFLSCVKFCSEMEEKSFGTGTLFYGQDVFIDFLDKTKKVGQSLPYSIFLKSLGKEIVHVEDLLHLRKF